MKDREADGRFTSATGLNLSVEMQQDHSRTSLYDRLADVKFTLPPPSMRERDVVLLAKRFLERAWPAAGFRQLSPAAGAHLLSVTSVREARALADAIERIPHLTSERIVTPKILVAVGLPKV